MTSTARLVLDQRTRRSGKLKSLRLPSSVHVILLVMRVAIIGTYVAILLGMVVAVNADAANGNTALLVWSVASLVLGWTIRHPLTMILPFLAIPIAVPFGYAEEWQGSDAPLLYLGMAFQAPFQALVVSLGLGGRVFFERVRARIDREVESKSPD